MGRSVLSPTQLSMETISPMPFIVILLVIGSINAMPNPTSDIETGEDVTPLTGPTQNPPDNVGGGYVYNDNNYAASPRRPRSPRRVLNCGIVGCESIEV